MKGIGRLGLEGEHISWARLRRWSEGWAKDVELAPTSDLVEGLRAVKDAGEVARIAAAAAIAVRRSPTERSFAVPMMASCWRSTPKMGIRFGLNRLPIRRKAISSACRLWFTAI